MDRPQSTIWAAGSRALIVAMSFATSARSWMPSVTTSPSLMPQPAKSKATSVAPRDAAVASSGLRTTARRQLELLCR